MRGDEGLNEPWPEWHHLLGKGEDRVDIELLALAHWLDVGVSFQWDLEMAIWWSLEDKVMFEEWVKLWSRIMIKKEDRENSVYL